VAKALDKLEALDTSATEERSKHRARAMVRKCINSITMKSERSASQVAMLGLGLPSEYKSHRYKTMVYPPFLQYLQPPKKPQTAIFHDNDDESHQITVDPEGRVALTNQRIDYMLRGTHVAMDVSPYEYFSKFLKVTKKQAGKKTSFLLHPSHPQFQSHTIIEEPNPDNVILTILGPAYPISHNPGERERLAMLLLSQFKPWRTCSDLKEPAQTWTIACNDWRNSLTAGVAPFTYLANIDTMSVGRTQQQQLNKLRTMPEELQSLEKDDDNVWGTPEDPFKKVFQTSRDEDAHAQTDALNMLALDAFLNVYDDMGSLVCSAFHMPPPPSGRVGKHVTRLESDLQQAGGFSHILPEPDADSHQQHNKDANRWIKQPHFTTKDGKFQVKMWNTSKHKAANEARQIKADQAATEETKSTASSKTTDPYGRPAFLNDQARPTPTQAMLKGTPTLRDIADDPANSLNDKQAEAFFLVGEAFLLSLASTSKPHDSNAIDTHKTNQTGTPQKLKKKTSSYTNRKPPSTPRKTKGTKRNRPKSPEPPSLAKDPSQFLHAVFGPGGTGKTRLANAITSLFAKHGCSNRLRLTAHMHSAAANIQGDTLASLFGLHIHNRATVDEAGNDLEESAHAKAAVSRAGKYKVTPKTRARWRGVSWLLVDEVSMLDCSTLEDMNWVLRQIFQYDKPFGGINIIFMGDFMQLPPVTAASFPLYSDKATTAQQGCGGRLLWKLVESCTVLTESKRSNCPTLNKVLHAIRTGTTNVELHAEMMKRVLANLPSKVRSHFLQNATIITSTQVVKHRVAIASDSATKTGTRPLLVVSRDVPTLSKTDKAKLKKNKQSPTIPDSFQRLLWATPAAKLGRGVGPGTLFLHPSCKLMLTENEHPALGSYNTQRVDLVKVALHPDEPPFDNDPRLGVHTLHFAPLYIVVKIPGDRFPDLKEGLSARELPISPVRRTYTYTSPTSIDDIIDVKMARYQFPLQSAKAITIHAAQGKTEPLVLADLSDAPGMPTDQSMLFYTLCSRATSWEDIAFLQPFDISLVQRPPSPELLEELSRIDKAATETSRLFKTRTQSTAKCDKWLKKQMMPTLTVPTG
jgi:hypothetical protein